MSGGLFISLWRNKRFDDPQVFLAKPDLAVSFSSREREDVSCTVTQPLTPETGAQLRALADEVDAVWAEWAASRKGQQRASA